MYVYFFNTDLGQGSTEPCCIRAPRANQKLFSMLKLFSTFVTSLLPELCTNEIWHFSVFYPMTGMLKISISLWRIWWMVFCDRDMQVLSITAQFYTK